MCTLAQGSLVWGFTRTTQNAFSYKVEKEVFGGPRYSHTVEHGTAKL